uniref:Potassium/proton antiporter CemA n=1 Tax=Bracteacoccus giganteus TaxID=50039 RepID=A0A0S2LPV4_9CHLO|nr:chloroplast enveloppe membrane protein [Bracteacoccus giganteus]ALO63493.1 chloroplast enveloppe membrane protein [Bracteacoccus giganteus]
MKNFFVNKFYLKEMTIPPKPIKISRVTPHEEKNFLIWFQSKLNRFFKISGETYMHVSPVENNDKIHQNNKSNEYTREKEYNEKQNSQQNENNSNSKTNIRPASSKKNSVFTAPEIKNSLSSNKPSFVPSLDSELMCLKFPNVLDVPSNSTSSSLEMPLDSIEAQTSIIRRTSGEGECDTSPQKFLITENTGSNVLGALGTNEEQRFAFIRSFLDSNIIKSINWARQNKSKTPQFSSEMYETPEPTDEWTINAVREEIPPNIRPIYLKNSLRDQSTKTIKKSFVSNSKKLPPLAGNAFYDKTYNENTTYSAHNKKNLIENRPIGQNSRFMDVLSSPKQPSVSITYEEIGLFPRSFNRVFDRFFKQLFFDVENLVIQEYRFYRYLFLTTVKCVFILIFVPFLVNFVCKNYLVKPITEYYWNSAQPEIFLNSYQQKRAFRELKDFEEKIYFESLIDKAHNPTSAFGREIFSSKDAPIKQTYINTSQNKKNNKIILRSIDKNEQLKLSNNSRSDDRNAPPDLDSMYNRFLTETHWPRITQNFSITNKIAPNEFGDIYAFDASIGSIGISPKMRPYYSEEIRPEVEPYYSEGIVRVKCIVLHAQCQKPKTRPLPRLFVNEKITNKSNVSESFNSYSSFDRICSLNLEDHPEACLFSKTQNKNTNNFIPNLTSNGQPMNFITHPSERFIFHPSDSPVTVHYASNQNMHDIDQTVVEINENNFMNTLSYNRKDYKLNEYIQKRLQQKTLELAIHYNEESIESITNFFADLISFGTLCFLLFNLEIQINITKSFLLEVFFGLDDSKKSLLILFVTDLLVGYHSPNIWELFFQSLFDHYGLPESQTTIFLLVATLPVLLDVLFKYLIFRHLNRASPATVATYHAMIE